MLGKTVRVWLSVFSVGIVLVFAGCGEPPAEEQTFNFSYGEVNPDGHPITDGAYEFARIVEEETDGRITINVYSAGQLGSTREHKQSVQAGALDFYRGNALALGDHGSQKMPLFALPFVFEGREHQWEVLNGPVGEEVLQDLADQNMRMVGLAYFDDGARHIFASDKKIETLEDLQGLRIRVPENEIMMDAIEALGASPTPIAYGELYSSLQTGVVDGAENTIAGYKTNSFYEPSPYLTLNAQTTPPGVLIASERTWNNLAAEDQEIIREAAQKASDYVRVKTEEYEEGALKELEDRGVTITYIDDLSPWREAVESVYEEYGEGHEGLLEQIEMAR